MKWNHCHVGPWLPWNLSLLTWYTEWLGMDQRTTQSYRKIYFILQQDSRWVSMNFKSTDTELLPITSPPHSVEIEAKQNNINNQHPSVTVITGSRNSDRFVLDWYLVLVLLGSSQSQAAAATMRQSCNDNQQDRAVLQLSKTVASTTTTINSSGYLD